MIYGRFGDEVEIVSGDLDTGMARIRYKDDGSEADSLIGYLRADGGFTEIHDAIVNQMSLTSGFSSRAAAQAAGEQWLASQPGAPDAWIIVSPAKPVTRATIVAALYGEWPWTLTKLPVKA